MAVKIRPVFVVKEYGNGQPWIAIEYRQPNPDFPQGVFGLDLPAGTTLQKAQQMASTLSTQIEHFNHTPA